MGRTIDLPDIARPDNMATRIVEKYVDWEMKRQRWLNDKEEIREYIFANDTSTTSNGTLPWKNSTHVPKLCQIRDNLHANYMSTLFPNDHAVTWEGDDPSAESVGKRKAIEGYMANKMKGGGFKTEMSKIVLDYIDYGVCFGMDEFVAEQTTDPATGEKISGFIGPRVVRISPLDLLFDPTVARFEDTPKIHRRVLTIGSLKAEIDDHPEAGYLDGAFDRTMGIRHQLAGISAGDVKKNMAYQLDGFSSWLDYMQSDYIEVLDFYGDIYDIQTGELLKNYMVSVTDRCHVLRKQPNPSWLGKAPIYMCGWRQRPDNLLAMGPLDNLVGMQYRIDHLENAKADAFDLIIHPVIKIKGNVEDFDYGPGERIYIGDDGDVSFERPDTTMLNADTQITMYEQKMEEMAGAPKQAMGFRTPGEKTAYEVQILENGANRIFLNKTSYFEEVFMEPLLNAMLESARRNMGPSDLIRVLDTQYNVVDFMSVTKDDLSAAGKIRPVGARRFAEKANIVQNLTNFANSAIGQDPAVNVHISGLGVAQTMETLLELEKFNLVQPNIRVSEELQTAKLKQSGSNILQENNAAGGQAQATGPDGAPAPGPAQVAALPRPNSKGGISASPTAQR